MTSVKPGSERPHAECGGARYHNISNALRAGSNDFTHRFEPDGATPSSLPFSIVQAALPLSRIQIRVPCAAVDVLDTGGRRWRSRGR